MDGREATLSWTDDSRALSIGSAEKKIWFHLDRTHAGHHTHLNFFCFAEKFSLTTFPKTLIELPAKSRELAFIRAQMRSPESKTPRTEIFDPVANASHLANPRRTKNP